MHRNSLDMFSKACEHGIKAIIFIATQSIEGLRVKIGDVAENTGSPEAYTAKILGLLTRHKIVNSLKGPNGGFEISDQRMKSIRISEIVYAIDGDQMLCGCALGLSSCDEKAPCLIHYQLSQIRDDLRTVLENTTVHELALQLIDGKTILNR